MGKLEIEHPEAIKWVGKRIPVTVNLPEPLYRVLQAYQKDLREMDGLVYTIEEIMLSDVGGSYCQWFEND